MGSTCLGRDCHAGYPQIFRLNFEKFNARAILRLPNGQFLSKMDIDMSSFLNLTTDILDRFQGTEDHESRWIIANDIIQELGGSALLGAEFKDGHSDPLWIMSSMDQNWMNDYMAEELYEIDPFVRHLNTSTSAIKWQAGTRVACDKNKKEMDVFYDGLSRVYRSTVGTPYVANASGSRKILTFASEHDFQELGFEREGEPDQFGRLNVVMSLLAMNIGLPLISSDSHYQINPDLVQLSPRETEVLLLLAQGHMNARISEKLGIAEITVRKHTDSARKKLDASTREQALTIAILSGLIQP